MRIPYSYLGEDSNIHRVETIVILERANIELRLLYLRGYSTLI